jgi:predicted dehydrogenase
MEIIPIPSAPLRIAIIGAGNRSQTIYLPILASLKPWVEVVAVCDPVQEHCQTLASLLGVPTFFDIRELVKTMPVEAAIIVTPVESHHAISVYLSSHGIHNLVETSWASMVCQTQEMITVARKHAVVIRVAENFFRFPIDRFAQVVKSSGYLGSIGRIFSYADHTGYHNNSRWIVFAGAHPEWVQCVEHSMPHPAYYSMPQRRHEKEILNARFFGFRDGFMVVDNGSGHVKGHLGRHPRPGYTEWQGERGTLVHRSGVSSGWGGEQTELRYVSDARLAPAQESSGELLGGGVADVITPVVQDIANEVWFGSHADTPSGCIAYESPLRTFARMGKVNNTEWYGVAVMDHVVDFALAVRGIRPSEFTDEDALMSEMMEVGARESALNEGKRVRLPVTGDLEADAITRQNLRKKYGVDPLDVEAMLSISYPRP